MIFFGKKLIKKWLIFNWKTKFTKPKIKQKIILFLKHHKDQKVNENKTNP